MARILAGEDFGLFALGLLYIALLEVFLDLGLISSLIQQKAVGQRELSTCFWLLLLASVALFAASQAFAAAAFGALFDEERLGLVIRALSVAILVLPVSATTTAILTRQLRLDAISKLELIAALLRCAIVIALGLAGFGLMSLVYGFVVERIVLALSLAAVARWRPHMVLGIPEVFPLLVFGAHITLGRLLWLAYSRLDTLIIGRVLGAETLGIYTVASQMANAFFQFISSAYYRIAFPVLAQLQDSPKLVDVFIKASTYLAIASLPVFLGLFAVSRDLVVVLLGDRWIEVVPVLQVLAIVAALQTLSGLLPQVANAAGHPALTTRINLGSTVVFGLGFYAGAAIAGLPGVLAVWVVLFPIRYLVMAFMTSALIRMPLGAYFGSFVRPTLAASAMMLMVAVFDSLLTGWHPTVRLISSILLGCVVYVALSWVLYKDMLRSMIQFVRPEGGGGKP